MFLEQTLKNLVNMQKYDLEYIPEPTSQGTIPERKPDLKYSWSISEAVPDRPWKQPRNQLWNTP